MRLAQAEQPTAPGGAERETSEPPGSTVRLGSVGGESLVPSVVQAVAIDEPKQRKTAEIHGFRVNYSMPPKRGIALRFPVTLTRDAAQIGSVTFMLEVAVGQDLASYQTAEFERSVEHAVALLALAQDGYITEKGAGLADSFTLTAAGRAELNGSGGRMTLDGTSVDPQSSSFAKQHSVGPSRLNLIFLRAAAIRRSRGTIDEASKKAARQWMFARLFAEDRRPLKPYKAVDGQPDSITLIDFWSSHLGEVFAGSFAWDSDRLESAQQLKEELDAANDAKQRVQILRQLVTLFMEERKDGIAELGALRANAKPPVASPAWKLLQAVHSGADQSVQGGSADRQVSGLSGLDVKLSELESGDALARIAGLRRWIQYDIDFVLRELGFSDPQRIAFVVAPHKHGAQKSNKA